MNRRNVFALIMALAMAATLTACTRPASKPVAGSTDILTATAQSHPAHG